VRKVTKTGRAISPGTVTRKSQSVKRRFKGASRPLPLNLQCHPKALKPTPINPGCYAYSRQNGRSYEYRRALGAIGILNGEKLQKSGKYRIELSGKPLGFLDDVVSAVAYRSAGRSLSIELEIIENESIQHKNRAV